MLIYIVAAVEALAYLSAVPVCAAFSLSTEGGLRFGVGLGAFERRFALRRARRASVSADKKPRRRGRGDPKRLWQMVSRLRGADIRLSGRLGLGDAAATAVACGALGALGTALGARAGRVRIDVAPRFDSCELSAELRGMIRARSGQIISAMASGQIDAISRRISKWKSIRSKAS